MNKWLKRIGTGLASAASSFVVVSIMYKLTFSYDNWLYRTIMMSAPWVAITVLKYYLIIDKGWKQRRFVITIAATVFIATLFVAGVCMSHQDYWELSVYTTFCFTYPTFTPLLRDSK